MNPFSHELPSCIKEKKNIYTWVGRFVYFISSYTFVTLIWCQRLLPMNSGEVHRKVCLLQWQDGTTAVLIQRHMHTNWTWTILMTFRSMIYTCSTLLSSHAQYMFNIIHTNIMLNQETVLKKYPTGLMASRYLYILVSRQ